MSRTSRVESRFFEISFFPKLPVTRTKSRSLSSVGHCNFIPDFSNSPIIRANFRFPWRFEKSGGISLYLTKVIWHNFFSNIRFYVVDQQTKCFVKHRDFSFWRSIIQFLYETVISTLKNSRCLDGFYIVNGSYSSIRFLAHFIIPFWDLTGCFYAGFQFQKVNIEIVIVLAEYISFNRHTLYSTSAHQHYAV